MYIYVPFYAFASFTKPLVFFRLVIDMITYIPSSGTVSLSVSLTTLELSTCNARRS